MNREGLNRRGSPITNHLRLTRADRVTLLISNTQILIMDAMQTEEERLQEEYRRYRKSRFAFRTVGQISAGLAAVSLVTMLHHFVNFHRLGFLNSLTDYWAGVRDQMFTPLKLAFDWTVPILLRDYIMVGVLFGFSYFRALSMHVFWRHSQLDTVGKLWPIILGVIPMWPLFILAGMGHILRPIRGQRAKDYRAIFLLLFLPFAYLGLLIVANYLLVAVRAINS